MRYEKIHLPYTYGALEPYIDRETIEIHYSKLLQNYVNKINEVFIGYDNFIMGKSLEEIISKPKKIPKIIRQKVINYGGGVINHNLYFSILYPNPKKAPEGALLEAINNKFNDINTMIDIINKTAMDVFGSGYAWLVKDKKGRLDIIRTSNQDSPFSMGVTPILTIDVWEHSYFLKYKNERNRYLENIWNVINWAKIEELYKC